MGHTQDASLAGFYEAAERSKGTYQTVGVVRAEREGRVHICLPLCDPIEFAHLSVELVDGHPCILVTVEHPTNKDVCPPTSVPTVSARTSAYAPQPVANLPAMVGHRSGVEAPTSQPATRLPGRGILPPRPLVSPGSETRALAKDSSRVGQGMQVSQRPGRSCLQDNPGRSGGVLPLVSPGSATPEHSMRLMVLRSGAVTPVEVETVNLGWAAQHPQDHRPARIRANQRGDAKRMCLRDQMWVVPMGPRVPRLITFGEFKGASKPSVAPATMPPPAVPVEPVAVGNVDSDLARRVAQIEELLTALRGRSGVSEAATGAPQDEPSISVSIVTGVATSEALPPRAGESWRKNVPSVGEVQLPPSTSLATRRVSLRRRHARSRAMSVLRRLTTWPQR